MKSFHFMILFSRYRHSNKFHIDIFFLYFWRLIFLHFLSSLPYQNYISQSSFARGKKDEIVYIAIIFSHARSVQYIWVMLCIFWTYCMYIPYIHYTYRDTILMLHFYFPCLFLMRLNSLYFMFSVVSNFEWLITWQLPDYVITLNNKHIHLISKSEMWNFCKKL